ncbi:MAG: tRNA (adenosine(37)-N6)-dimethylallyltransferase MiaA [Gemmatales bacterium]|nr:tRNA (adenosine(37)-N6)-dimethylallyltransferase MiaA [Gemmatales bacterium]MDW8387402.1 tRNA (adenosine(37)-N6)-dimethylallyltransferase MiaA [Gemmatales bacterium]
MDPAVFDPAFILTGPTATGKSAIALVIAERIGADIISMDSMALYRGMDIGTAKPSLAERQRVRHHLIDVLDPWESASVAWWLKEAARCCRDILGRGKHVLIQGGTPLYLKALLRGLFEGPPADPELRRRLHARSPEELHAELSKHDPVTAARLHPHDVKRIVRALEVLEATGKPISAWQREFDRPRPRPHPPIWLNLPRTVLYDRINRRVDRMMEAGLLDEVRALAASPKPLSREARQALGYKELLDHLAGNISLTDAVDRIKTRSRQFAKRQLTWFRHLEECQRLEIQPEETPEQIAQRLLDLWGFMGRSISQNR